jgi:hypothetical protein
VGVKAARFLPSRPPFIKRGRSVGRYAVGIRYEREVHELLELYCLGKTAIELKLGPWLEFTDRRGRRWCQPDALLLNREQKACLICEIKYQHTSDAWWQLKHLYQPVLAVALPGFTLSLVEVVHWFDPLVAWPEQPQLIPQLSSSPSNGTVAVHICNPRRRAQL